MKRLENPSVKTQRKASPEPPSKVPCIRSEELDLNLLTEIKAEKNRERNREHAKRTRLRKKEMLEAMKMRLLDLQRESAKLEQLLEESNTASILLCLHNPGKQDEAVQGQEPGADDDQPGPGEGRFPSGNIIDQLRHNVRVEAAQSFRPRYEQQALLGAAGEEVGSLRGDGSVDADFSEDDNESDEDPSVKEEGAPSDTSGPDKLSPKAPISIEQKRERNRMHAKLTRDRKKLFTSKMHEAIMALDRHNQMLRSRLDCLVPSGHLQPAAFAADGLGSMRPLGVSDFEAATTVGGFAPFFAAADRDSQHLAAAAAGAISGWVAAPTLHGDGATSSPAH